MTHTLPKYTYIATLLVLSMILLPFSLSAQDLLRNKMSLNMHQVSVREVLNHMERQGQFYFSYSSEIIPETRIVSVQQQEQTVIHILADLLGPAFRYQVSGNHIIIRSTISQGILVSGRLIEAESGQPIEYASVYEKSVMAGTMTDANGNFKLHIREPLPHYELVISKLSYEDTIIQVQKSFQPQQPIALKKAYYTLDSVSVVSVQNHWLARRLLSTKVRLNSLNLNSFFARQPFQFSVLPGISSKGRMLSQHVNKFSFNLLGGYSAGVEGFEYGTIFNIVQHDLHYAQLSGLFNIVGGEMKGAQVGGAYNYVRKDVSGVQLSAVFNAAGGRSRGVQVSGVYNRTLQLRGVQTSGVFNWSKDRIVGVQLTGVLNKARQTHGLQASGLANWNQEQLHGVQFAGVLNKNGSVDGFQCAGAVNYTHDSTQGVQIAGIANINRNIFKGVQIAGLFNRAREVKGTQIGLINIADTSSGWSIGLLSFIRKGKHSIDLATSEWQPYSVAYKSGTERLYNILQVGGNPHRGHRLLSVGYGIGHRSTLGSKSGLIQELGVHTLYAGNWNEQHILSRYQILYQYQLAPMVQLYAGPAFSVLYAENPTRTYDGYQAPFRDRAVSFGIGSHLNCWFGWTLGLSLF